MDQLAGLTEDARKLALERFRLLQPHLEDDHPLKAVAATAGIPFRSAQRWVSLYRQFGLTALARKKRTDTGKHREISVRLKEAIEGIALQKPPIPVAAICRQVRRLAQDLGEEPPSYWLVYRIVAALPADLVALLSNEKQVTRQTPPAFIWQTATDGAVPPENALLFALALHAKDVPFELHIFPEGPHGKAVSRATWSRPASARVLFS